MPVIDNNDILFIINPNSGGRKAARFVKEINSLDFNLSYVVTNNLQELDKAFKSNIEKYKVFIVVGGDGTVNEAVKYLIERDDKYFGVLPAGSGNGFARELGFKKSIKSLINDINKGESLNIDILSVNNKKCINVAGLGFDSFVAHAFAKNKSRGLKSYIYYTIKSIFIFKPFEATLKIDKKIIKDKFQMITIANTRQFGNNALIVPHAKPNDRIFEIALIKPFPFFIYPVFVLKLFFGLLKESKYIKYIKVDEIVEIESDYKKYHIDGEPNIFTDKLIVKMLKEKIKVIKTEHNRIEGR